MKKIINKPLEDKVKVSINLDRSFFEQVEKIAKLTKSPKGIVIEAVGFHGVPILLNQLEMNWKGLDSNGNLDKDKKIKIKKLLKDLETLKREIKTSA